ncbi:hypothetical protein I5U23_08155 [Stenotrophomonas maltophilia]|nr:hypothetical protein [Stenotrophomonas maltophilia]HDS1654978.1 hypothetical protein [Stenotrophomonas maltophilia]
MKDQISQDLLAAMLKTAPTATVAVATFDPARHLSLAVMVVTLLVGLSQFFTTVVKNWGDWMGWLSARWVDGVRLRRWGAHRIGRAGVGVARAWRWLRGR